MLSSLTQRVTLAFAVGLSLATPGAPQSVANPALPVLTHIQQRLQARPQEWLLALQQDPGKLADLEQEIQRAFAQMADQVVAGLLAETTAASDFAAAAKKK